MWGQLAIYGGILAGQYIYHRWIEDKDHPKRDLNFAIPRVTGGEPVPLIYGRTRVRAPVRAWVSKPSWGTNGFGGVGNEVYQLNQFYVIGIPFAEGAGTTRLHGMWQGDLKFDWLFLGDEPTGDAPDPVSGGVQDAINAQKSTGDGELAGLYVEFYNGRSTQKLVKDDGTPGSYAGIYMMDVGPVQHLNVADRLPADEVPSYRGYLSAMLHGADINAGSQWRVSKSGQIESYSFEASAYPPSGLYPSNWLFTDRSKIGVDANPADVIYDLLVSKFGKLGIDPSYIDFLSFSTAAVTLFQEGHGYSRSFESAMSGHDMIVEILEQIDAAIYEDMESGTLKIKLVRNDYDPNTIPVISKATGCEIQGLALGGWTGIVNKVRVVYTDRSKNYAEESAYAQNPANAVGQNGEVRELVLRMPGVHTHEQAAKMAARELAARSRPIMKLRALVNRSHRTLNPGDPVKVIWNDPDIGGIVFRVANVDRGTLHSNKIAIDLLQDFYYVYRGQSPIGGGFGHPPVVERPPVVVLGG